jgi:hypothetical protein
MLRWKNFSSPFPRPLLGDWLVIFISMWLVIMLFQTFWQSAPATKLRIRSGNSIYATLSLDQARSLNITGPLGTSRIVIDHGRARVASDPGPRQYCVKQGWLTRAGEVAMCLPNQVSIELLGAEKAYDSLNY